MSWIWRRGRQVVHVEKLPGRRALIDTEREPSPSDLRREAEQRDHTAQAARTWPMHGTAGHDDAESRRKRWKRYVLEHEVERRAQREGRGGRDE